MKIELTGQKEFQRNLKKVQSEIAREIERTTSASLLRIQSDARRKAPVDTGRLRAAIHHRQEGTSGEVAVYAHVSYAPYIEFGTGNMVSVPDELQEIAEEFRGRGVRQVNLPARPFMYPALVKERPKYTRNLKAVLGKSRTV